MQLDQPNFIKKDKMLNQRIIWCNKLVGKKFPILQIGKTELQTELKTFA